MMMSRGKKSRTCMGKKSGTPVTEYETKSDAINGASYAKDKFGTDLSPYQCSKCQQWHLAPNSTIHNIDNNSNNSDGTSRTRVHHPPPPAKSKTCVGTKSGTPLTEYETQLDAQRGADHANTTYYNNTNTDDSMLAPYSCSMCHKWHLSRSSSSSSSPFPNFSRAAETKKSRTCFGHETGQPVTEYETLDDAQRGAEYANTNTNTSKTNNNLVPYQCSECWKWHLSPESRQTPSMSSSNGCQCQGEGGTGASNGPFKQAYPTHHDAERRASILLQEHGVRLYTYQCPQTMTPTSTSITRVWHLTRREQRY